MNKWRYTVHFKRYIHDDGLTFEQTRDGIAKAIRRSGWFRVQHDDELECLVEELEETEHADDLDQVLDFIYDLADYDRAWIA